MENRYNLGRQRGGRKTPQRFAAEQKGGEGNKSAVGATHTFEAEGAGLFCAVLERRPGTAWVWDGGVTGPRSRFTGSTD